jgi:hypothetical protein
MTRAELMRHALSQALRRVHDLSGKKLKFDEDTRWQIAGEAVEELRRHGGWKELDEEAPMRPAGAGLQPSRQAREGLARHLVRPWPLRTVSFVDTYGR